MRSLIRKSILGFIFVLMFFVISSCGGSNADPNASTQVATHSSLINMSSEAAGSNCSTGGQKIDIGIDLDDNGTLDTTEITKTTYVCNAINGTTALVNVRAVTLAELLAGHCAGVNGNAIESGLDGNNDGILGAGEITNTAYVCNGVAGANGTDGTDAGITSNSFATGSALSIAHCGGYAGVAITPYLDGVAGAVSYVCNGVTGATGGNGTNASIATTLTCPYNYYHFLS